MLFRLIFRSSTFESESVLHRLSARSSECTLWYQQLCLRENMFLPYECRRTHPELHFIFKWVAHWADRHSCAESINSLTNKCIDKLISTGGMSLELFALYAGENITALKQKEVHWNYNFIWIQTLSWYSFSVRWWESLLLAFFSDCAGTCSNLKGCRNSTVTGKQISNGLY